MTRLAEPRAARCNRRFAWCKARALSLGALLATTGLVAAEDPVPAAATPAMTSVTVPLALDYPLLEELLIAQVFTGPGSRREVLEDPTGCSEVTLSEPALAPRDGQLELLAALRARIGVGGGGSCATLLTWEGQIGIQGVPDIRGDGTTVGFTAQQVRLLDPSGEPVANDRLQALAQAGVRAAFERFVVDLKPQLQSVAGLLPAVLPRYSREQIDTLLGTLRVADIAVQPATLDVAISFAVEALSQPLPPERALTDAELVRWEERWQLMDALLVLAVKHYAAATPLQALREALLDALIESRYRLRDALTEPPDTGADPVRAWFLQSWQALAPVIRQIGMDQPGQEHLLLLSVIAATDALEALDRLGPAVGLDISADGLRRLARLINGAAGDELLQYSGDVDPELRRLLDESLRDAPPSGAWRVDFSLFPKAFAASAERLNSWAPRRDDLAEYLPLVAQLLNTSAEEAAGSRKLDREYRALFRQLVLTTAWQESCWRHYVVSDDRKLVPLRSGTGDVGLMQVNERVWRGFYDQQRLRWDIHYNGAVGAEVLADYFVKYALRKGEHRQPGGLANLARASYSAYNGGPSQVARYRSASASAYGSKVDAAFWDKYQQVAAGNELAVSGCFGADLRGPATAPAAPGTAAAAGDFTLQLGAFSSEQAARSFLAQHALGSDASVVRRGNGANAQYLVLYGDYATRAQAEAARTSLIRLEPWIRRRADLPQNR